MDLRAHDIWHYSEGHPRGKASPHNAGGQQDKYLDQANMYKFTVPWWRMESQLELIVLKSWKLANLGPKNQL